MFRIGNLITAHQSDPAMAFEEAVASVPADKLLGGTLQSLADCLAHSKFHSDLGLALVIHSAGRSLVDRRRHRPPLDDSTRAK